ncbi:MAG: hypothetical protein VYE62_06800, partial [Pseudomonadota bacterium]|nr:hypothetical protein [Pseudomonadota bacterium]
FWKSYKTDGVLRLSGSKLTLVQAFPHKLSDRRGLDITSRYKCDAAAKSGESKSFTKNTLLQFFQTDPCRAVRPACHRPGGCNPAPERVD